MALKSSPFIPISVLRSHTERATTLRLMRNTLAELRFTSIRTRALMEETRLAIAQADAILANGSGAAKNLV